MTILRSGSATDTGLVRSVNQDLALETPNLYAVADGMGGHAGGEVAAQVAIDSLLAAFNRQPTGSGLSQAASEANAVVWQQSLDRPELRGMGTTLTALSLVNEDGTDVLALVNVGDSRTYRLHQGELTQLTTDHSLAEEMVRSGELSAVEAEAHPHRHILTRALGVADEVAVDLWRIQPVEGDRYLLCSDGLTNEIDDAQITEVLTTVADPETAADLLVRAARAHGGSDNITVVVVDVVVGEEGDGTTPEVAAASPDFRPAPAAVPERPAGAAATPAEDVPDATGVTTAVTRDAAEEPSRRERRKATRRARRAARGRRLITVRTLIFVGIVVAVVLGALYAVKWYDSNSYFVKVDSGTQELVIYQGRIGGFLWYHPVERQRTGATLADVPDTYRRALTAGVQESSLVAAQTYVSRLVCDQLQDKGRLCTGTGTTTTAPTTTVPTTTTAPPTTTAAVG